MARAPVTHDLITYAGEVEVLEITIEDEGDPADLGGATLAYSLSKGQGGVALVELAGVLAGSVATVTLDDTDTALTPGLYWHEARLSEITGRVSTVMVGRVLIQAPAVPAVP